MPSDEMLVVYQRHRAAEEARDLPTVMETLTTDCFLEHVSLGLRSVGRDDATRAYEDRSPRFPTWARYPAVSPLVTTC